MQYLLRPFKAMPQRHPTDRFGKLKYLFGRPLLSSDFLKRNVSTNFRDTRNLMSVVFGLLKMSFLVPKKGRLSFSSGKAIRPKVFGKWTKKS